MKTTELINQIADHADKLLRDRNGCRLRTRRIDERRIVEDVLRVLLQYGTDGGMRYETTHGGSVANSYRWPAETEAIAFAAARRGNMVHCWIEAGRMPAKKITTAAVVTMFADGAFRAIADDRYNGASKTAAIAALTKALCALPGIDVEDMGGITGAQPHGGSRC